MTYNEEYIYWAVTAGDSLFGSVRPLIEIIQGRGFEVIADLERAKIDIKFERTPFFERFVYDFKVKESFENLKQDLEGMQLTNLLLHYIKDWVDQMIMISRERFIFKN